MRIVAFVQDPMEIKNIMNSLGLPDFRAPPPIPIQLAGSFEEYASDTFPDYAEFTCGSRRTKP